ncbi:MAG: cell division protein SepF [Eggerthellaceae bacterium]
MPLFGDRSGSGFFNDLKTRLGFAPREDYDDEYDVYSDNFDDFSTYEDDDAAFDAFEGADDRLDDGSYYDDGYSQGYADSYMRAPANDRRSQSGQRNYGSLSLPNIYDVRNGVQRSERERLSNGARIPYYSEGYPASGQAGYQAASGQAYASGRFAYAGNERRIALVAPTAYDDAERIARALKAGDCVVLDLARTRTDVMKRVLDFSFGAASVVNAKVECIADRVFAITLGGPITEGELSRLRSQGVRL